ncbi:MAG: hypothetical protein SFX73_12790 [Kofleriaceae bacterium]|nr:hypothetical protein [Kofleriaceae bacterium]
MWDELWIENDVANDVIAAAVALAHGVALEQVEVIDGIATESARTSAVSVHRTRGGGQFAMRLQLSGTEPSDRRVFCARLASALGCKVLGDDGNVNPFTFMLYEQGNAMRVSVDIQQIEEHAPVVLGPYDASRDDEGHPTRPIRRLEPGSAQATRGAQLAKIVNEYMVEGLPRPPLVTWSPATTELYGALHKLLGTLVFRKATKEDLAHIREWSATLARTFPSPENAGYFVVELLEASGLVLAEPWDPEASPIPIQR